MQTGLWPRVWNVGRRRQAAGRDGLRVLAAQLALQTVVLVLIMLLALGGAVYLFTQNTLLHSLESTLQQRAEERDPNLCAAYELSCGNGPGGPRGRGPHGHSPLPPFGPSSRGPGASPGSPSLQGHATGPSDASAVYVDLGLHIRHGDGVLGSLLLDRDDVREAIETRQAHCCDTESHNGTAYLIYAAPVWYGGQVIGGVETSISTRQYENTLQSLLQILLSVALIGIVLTAGISIILVRRAIRPIAISFQRQRDFVADAAHELRTPLAIQRTVGDVGMGDGSVEELQRTVSLMMEENHHLTRLVDDLSLLARSDSNAVSIERELVNLSAVIEGTTSELSYLAEEQGVQLQTSVAPHILVTGDVLRLRQMLLVLLDNALKYTPSGGLIRVDLGVRGKRARLQVADTGPGIDPEHLPRIFDRFYRADTARSSEGSGLGLAIARWVVGAHGGTITASNASGGGAVFTVSLPIAAVSVQPRETPVRDGTYPS